MKFVYKIHSGYDGFTPRRIKERLEGNRLSLGWARYLESVERGMEVWVYFRGPHAFEDGVYVRGVVSAVEFEHERVLLTVREYADDAPITDPQTTELVRDIVAPRYRQVFVLPEEIDAQSRRLRSRAPARARVRPVECDVVTSASSCAAASCTACAVWETFPLIEPGSMWFPPKLDTRVTDLVPGFWVIPTRCYLPRWRIKLGVKRTSELFYRFKLGEGNLAFTLALGVYRRLEDEDFDCIVPIPLSPDKAKRGELHRSRALAVALGRMMSTPVVDGLTLSESISKRRMLAAGWSLSSFVTKYMNALKVSPKVTSAERILLVDDVSTRGTTLSTAARRLWQDVPNTQVIAATGGQMILKPVVRKESTITT